MKLFCSEDKRFLISINTREGGFNEYKDLFIQIPELKKLKIDRLHNLTATLTNETEIKVLKQLVEINESDIILLEKLQNLEITEKEGVFMLKGKIKDKFLGVFSLNHKRTYALVENQLVRKKAFFDFLWKEVVLVR